MERTQEVIASAKLDHLLYLQQTASRKQGTVIGLWMKVNRLETLLQDLELFLIHGLKFMHEFHMLFGVH